MELPLELQINIEMLKANAELVSLIESKLGKDRYVDAWTVVKHNPESITYCFATCDAKEPKYRRDYEYVGRGLVEASPDKFIAYVKNGLEDFDPDWKNKKSTEVKP